MARRVRAEQVEAGPAAKRQERAVLVAELVRIRLMEAVIRLG